MELPNYQFPGESAGDVAVGFWGLPIFASLRLSDFAHETGDGPKVGDYRRAFTPACSRVCTGVCNVGAVIGQVDSPRPITRRALHPASAAAARRHLLCSSRASRQGRRLSIKTRAVLDGPRRESGQDDFRLVGTGRRRSSMVRVLGKELQAEGVTRGGGPQVRTVRCRDRTRPGEAASPRALRDDAVHLVESAATVRIGATDAQA